MQSHSQAFCLISVNWHSPTGVVNGNQSFVFSGAYFWKTLGQLSHPSYFREKDETRNPKGTGEDSLGRFLSCTESFLGQDICTCMSSDGTFLSRGGAEFSRELRLSVTQTVIQQRMASVSWGFVYWKEVQWAHHVLRACWPCSSPNGLAVLSISLGTISCWCDSPSTASRTFVNHSSQAGPCSAETCQ